MRSRRWAFFSDNRADFGVKLICRVLGVSRVGYYRHLATEEARATRRVEEKRTVAEIWGIHAEHGGAYGEQTRTLTRVLVTRTAPDLLVLPGVGTETAGQLLVTAGDNPNRRASEASFAHLCAAAPVSGSSGRTDRHRLSRGGDRQASRALHMIAVVRMRYCPRTRAYVARRTQQGLSKKDIIRCLKRFIAREVYHALTRTHNGNTASST
ncbi:transposase [Streptomyces microflavus]|uniref:transposase n=1 Tax=Streptomyces microflavus TaxID=1919 RepID=UPI0030B886D0